jgi:FKBP-type peptidyl-prolyl cis-trans isomerase
LKRLLVAVLVAVLAGALMACSSSDDMTGTDTCEDTGTLVVQDVRVGTGATAAAGNTVTVHYVGTFTNGQEFDSSRRPGRTPLTFRLGAGTVIAGFDQGITGMKVGGIRRLTIPPDLAYGNNPPPGIPPCATLLFEIELLAVQ